MGYGFIQLQYIGKKNNYLSDNTGITFFKIVYKKYSNFSIENKIIKYYRKNLINDYHFIIPIVGDMINKINYNI